MSSGLCLEYFFLYLFNIFSLNSGIPCVKVYLFFPCFINLIALFLIVSGVSLLDFLV